MLVLWSAFFGVLIFFAIVLLTLVLGAVARESEKEALLRTAREREAGLTEDFTSDTRHPLHERYVDA